MQISPYLMFNGECETAFKFYEQCLGGTITAMMTFAEAPDMPPPDEVPPEWHQKIMHTSLKIGDQELMGSDSPPKYYEAAKGFSVTLNLTDLQEAERIFHNLAENGQVQMPLEKTFWADRFGMVVDQFGIPWMINCDQNGHR